MSSEGGGEANKEMTTMNCNRVKWGTGLMALVVLTFGLAGCGSEPAPVVQPPAPPPAPPPFQPQAVEVALGESGGTVTLMTAEGGGYTYNGEAFAGGEVEAENGNKYLLALEDDKWMAVFQAPAGIDVMLGDHGGTVTITKAEDGTYWIGEMGIESGGSVTAENGNMYTLTMTMDEEGNAMWSAMYVAMEGMVTVASLDLEITATRAEDGTWTAVHPLTQETITLTEGGMIMAGDNSYMLSSDGMGMWTASFVTPDPEMVMLGMHGGSVMLQRAEDGTWWYGEELFESGGMIMGTNGHYYTLTMDDDGMWMAMWNKPDSVSVTVGTSGTVMLQQAEDLSWWIGDEAFYSGDSYTASNGNMYVLTMDEDGMWSSMFQPGMMMIEGTGLYAMSREDGMGYDVMGSEDALPEDGMGDVTVDGAMYHVWMDDGMLMGTRFDAAIHADTDMKIGDIMLPTLSGEDEDTVATELRTKLNVADRSFSIGTLLSQGSASDPGDNIVGTALDKIETIRSDVSALLALDSEPPGLTGILGSRWGAIQTQINSIFGTGEVDLPGDADNPPDQDDILSDIDDIISALSSEDGFAEATLEDGNGVFEDAALADDKARDAFNASKTESMANFGMTAMTRYGAVWQKQRANATSDLKYTMGVEDDPDTGDDETVERMGYVGAFAWSTVDDVLRTRNLPDSGNAYYEGGTRAVSGAGKLYAGVMEIEIRFRNKRVSGLISDLQAEDGEPWVYQFGDVESIILPSVTMNGNAGWTGTGNAQITYAQRAGSPRPPLVESSFAGELTGIDSQGAYAHGTWSVGNSASDGEDYLAAGFGAMRTDETDDTRPGTDDGSISETAMFSSYGQDTESPPNDLFNQAINDEGVLTLTTDLWGRARVTANGTDGDANTDDDVLTYLPAAAVLTETVDGATQNKKQVFEIDLATLIADVDEFTVNSDTQVEIAEAALEKIRSDLAVLQGLETRSPASERAQWRAVKDALAALFHAPHPNTVPTADSPATSDDNLAVPAKFDVPYDDDTALGLIDRALNALSSEDALEDALDPDGSGIFKGAHQTAGSLTLATTDDKYAAVGDIWGRRAARVKVWTGSTDYTRFGAWRKQRNSYAVNGYDDVSEGTATEARDMAQVFAYSQLKPTLFRSGDPSFPATGSAAYSGHTIAVKDSTFVEGDVMVHVTWAAAGWLAGEAVTTSLVATLSDLRNAANGDPLMYYNGTEAKEIGSIIMSGVNASHVESGDNKDQIRFSGAPTVRLTYADLSEVDVSPLLSGETHSLSGVFVGRNVDGPLGVIGMWGLGLGSPNYDHDGDTGETDATPLRDPFGLGTSSRSFMGAFGADAP